jgi:hypothetical protein
MPVPAGGGTVMGSPGLLLVPVAGGGTSTASPELPGLQEEPLPPHSQAHGGHGLPGSQDGQLHTQPPSSGPLPGPWQTPLTQFVSSAAHGAPISNHSHRFAVS